MTDDDALRAALTVEIAAPDQCRFTAEVLTRRARSQRKLRWVERVVWAAALAGCGIVAAPLFAHAVLSPANLAGLGAAAAGLWVSLRLDRPAV